MAENSKLILPLSVRPDIHLMQSTVRAQLKDSNGNQTNIRSCRLNPSIEPVHLYSALEKVTILFVLLLLFSVHFFLEQN